MSGSRLMPTFVFSMANEPTVEVTLPNVTEAKCVAALLMGRTVCDEAQKFWETGDRFLSVSDDRGLVLFTLQVIGHDAPVLRISDAPVQLDPPPSA